MVKKFALCRTRFDLAPVHCLYEIIIIMFSIFIHAFSLVTLSMTER